MFVMLHILLLLTTFLLLPDLAVSTNVLIDFYRDASCQDYANTISQEMGICSNVTGECDQACHSWERSTADGGTRTNSAANFKCFRDWGIQYTQWVNTATCSGRLPQEKMSKINCCIAEPSGRLWSRISLDNAYMLNACAEAALAPDVNDCYSSLHHGDDKHVPSPSSTSSFETITCDNETCNNGGRCRGGSCQCAAGFEGTFCAVNIDDCLDDTTCAEQGLMCVDGIETFSCVCNKASCQAATNQSTSQPVWSNFTGCSAMCGQGTQTRTCLSGLCTGPSVKPCYNYSCEQLNNTSSHATSEYATPLQEQQPKDSSASTILPILWIYWYAAHFLAVVTNL